jgi:hypothetical protein
VITVILEDLEIFVSKRVGDEQKYAWLHWNRSKMPSDFRKRPASSPTPERLRTLSFHYASRLSKKRSVLPSNKPTALICEGR